LSFVADPYPTYAILRERDPVHFSTRGFWVVTRYHDIVPALKDLRLSNAPAPFALAHRRNRERFVFADVANGIISFLDPPDHTRPRRVIAAALQEHLKDKEALIADVADELLFGLKEKPRLEFLQEFCLPFATNCVRRLIGYRDITSDRLHYWTNLFFHLFHPIPNREIFQRVNDAIKEFRQHTQEIVAARKKRREDDLISRLLNASDEGELSEQEIIDNGMLIAADGIENVATGLANAIATLIQHEDQTAKLIKQPHLSASAVAECLRYQTPAQWQGRIAADDLDIAGKKIPAGSVVLLVLASANRDPLVVPDADCFDITRSNFRHVAFGSGRHACIGGSMVNKEFKVALHKIFDGSRKLKLEREVTWRVRAGHRWPESVHVQIED